MSYCISCGEPLSEFELCSYGDMCMTCYDELEEDEYDPDDYVPMAWAYPDKKVEDEE